MSKKTEQQNRARKTEEHLLHNKQVAEELRSKEQQVDWKQYHSYILAEKVRIELDMHYITQALENNDKCRNSIRDITQPPPFRGQWRYFDMQLSFIKYMLEGAIDILRYLMDRLARMEKVAQMMMEEQSHGKNDKIRESRAPSRARR